ncbi:hypothetical protein [Halorubrum sp. 48-1-W]|uniref:hypothetical protein n=1 Tax=Halorubrum sp. 48-1-W TaxID=2249761 RepID=UPI000FCC7C8F|nr:hypothetical protein [Halorubrum sp. 48-1-W]
MVFMIFILILSAVPQPVYAQENCLKTGNTTLNSPPTVSVTLREGPLYHGFYDRFSGLNETIVVITVSNPKQNSESINIHVFSKIVEQFYWADLETLPELFGQNIQTYRDSYCIEDLGPGSSIVIGYKLDSPQVSPSFLSSDPEENKFEYSGMISTNITYLNGTADTITHETEFKDFGQVDESTSFSSALPAAPDIGFDTLISVIVTVLIGLVGIVLTYLLAPESKQQKAKQAILSFFSALKLRLHRYWSLFWNSISTSQSIVS